MTPRSFAHLPFSLLLPLLELTVWAIFVPLQTAILYQRLDQLDPGANVVHIHTSHFESLIPRDRLFKFALERTTYLYSRPVASANFPGAFFQVLIPSSPRPWHPAGMPYDSWRCISFPFLSLPCWWLVGLGLEGVGTQRRLPPPIWITGSILCTLSIAGLIAFRLGLSPAERIDEDWVLWGIGLWALAFGMLPLARLRSRGPIIE
jgi:hypothetical protein